MPRFRLGLALLAGALLAASPPPAHAVDFTLTKSAASGAITLSNNTTTYGISELVVSGLGTTAGTTRPGWSAAAFLFDDPLGCLDGTSFTTTGGFCYKLTDTALGQPIGLGSETFSFDPTLDLGGPSDFFLLFSAPGGATLACTGNTDTGCNAPASAVPVPPSLLLLASGLVAFGVTRRRVARGTAALASAVAVLPVLAGWAGTAEARVTRIVVDSRAPAYGGAAQGDAGAYETITGRAFGTLDPADSRNALIQDIGLAPKNAQGQVGYISTFTIIKPVDLSRSNGVMLYQVPNRGGKVDPATNGMGVSPGAIYLENGWQGDLLANCTSGYPCQDLNATPAGNTELLQVPVARNADGSSITGPVLGRIQGASGSTAQAIVYSRPVPYYPATLDTTAARITGVAHESITGEQSGVSDVAAGDWAWADCRTRPFPGTPDPTRICLRNGFDPSLLYYVRWIAKDPLVQGIGFAATRDVVSFFRRATADDAGTANPLASTVKAAIAEGTSQSGNFIKSFLFFGFNQDESGARVYDGAWPHIAARQNPLNYRFATPDGAATLYETGSEPVLWWSDYPDIKRGRPAAGLLDACRASGTCPYIFETFGATEFWDLRIAPGLIGTDGAQDIPLPANFYRYYFPGTSHNGGSGGFAYSPATTTAANAACSLPNNPNPEFYTMRALQDAFIAWLTAGVLPPPSVYPTLRNGQLVPQTRAATNFPAVPGLPFQDNFANPLFVYDFGASFNPASETGVIAQQPPAIDQIIPLAVVKTNTDGNEVAGIASVLHQAPLGSYLGWNVYKSGARAGTICAFSGGFYPFAASASERQAAGDPRPSLEERFGTHSGYACAVQAAAKRSVAQRFLRDVDATALVTAAQASNVLVGVAPTSRGMSLAGLLCAAAAR